MKQYLLATAAAVALTGAVSGGASAADLPLKARPSVPSVVAAPVGSWAGLYVGGHMGWGWGDTDIRETSGGHKINGPSEPDGLFGGAQVGYNF